MRSFLTLLGIILSTTTLIAVMSVIHGMDVFIAETASTMGNDGFRVVRVSFAGRRDPKTFLEAIRRNPELSREEFQFIKDNAKLSREAGMVDQRGVKVTYEGDLVDGVALLGGTPVKHVLNFEEGITRTRGRWGRYLVNGQEIPALPTFHPAYLLRQPAAKRQAWQDLLSLRLRLREMGAL